jgi:hypothetical protein
VPRFQGEYRHGIENFRLQHGRIEAFGQSAGLEQHKLSVDGIPVGIGLPARLAELADISQHTHGKPPLPHINKIDFQNQLIKNKNPEGNQKKSLPAFSALARAISK